MFVEITYLYSATNLNLRKMNLVKYCKINEMG
jgi:hypothetical protein